MSQDSANMQSVPGIGLGVRNVLMALGYRQLKELPHRKLLGLCEMFPRKNQSGKSGESARVSVMRKLLNLVQAVENPATPFNPEIYSKTA